MNHFFYNCVKPAFDTDGVSVKVCGTDTDRQDGMKNRKNFINFILLFPI